MRTAQTLLFYIIRKICLRGFFFLIPRRILYKHVALQLVNLVKKRKKKKEKKEKYLTKKKATPPPKTTKHEAHYSYILPSTCSSIKINIVGCIFFYFKSQCHYDTKYQLAVRVKSSVSFWTYLVYWRWPVIV